jgi:hypothetical protein
VVFTGVPLPVLPTEMPVFLLLTVMPVCSREVWVVCDATDFARDPDPTTLELDRLGRLSL